MRQKRRFIITFCASYVFSLLAIPAENYGTEIRIVVADDSDSSRKIVESLQKRLPQAQLVSRLSNSLSHKKNVVYLTVGPSALSSILLKETEGSVISIYTSRQIYKSTIEIASKMRSGSVTAIYAEPSPADQLQLISSIYKGPVKTGVLISESNVELHSVLQRAATNANIELQIEHVFADESLNRALNRLKDVQVILAVPDGAIFNSENFKHVLLTAYRRNQAVIGFTAALVKAGALATTYSDFDDIAVQVSGMIAEYQGTGRMPEPQYPKYINVAINESVARSLNIIVDKQIQRLARKPGVQ